MTISGADEYSGAHDIITVKEICILHENIHVYQMPICRLLLLVVVWNHRHFFCHLKPPPCRPPPISCCTSQNTFKRTRRSLPARAKVLGIPIVGHNQMQPCGCAVKATRRPRQRRCTVGHTGWSVSSVSRPLFGNVRAHVFKRVCVC